MKSRRVAALLNALMVLLAGSREVAHADGGPQLGETRASSWTDTDIPLTRAVSAGGEHRLAGGAPAPYHYVSPVKQANHPFNAIGVHWEADLPPGASLAVELRPSDDGQTWSAWEPAGPVDALRNDARDTDPMLLSGRYLQYRLELRSDGAASLRGPQGTPAPRIRQVRITYIDSTSGPTPNGRREPTWPFAEERRDRLGLGAEQQRAAG